MEPIEDKPIAEFAIIQNSRTKVSGVWTKERGEWVQAPQSDYVTLGLIAKLIRTNPNPVEVIELIKNEWEAKKSP